MLTCKRYDRSSQDIRELHARIDVPCLVLVGDQDQRTPIALSREIAGLIRGSRLEVIPDSGHLPNLDNPSWFHQAVDTFLSAGTRVTA